MNTIAHDIKSTISNRMNTSQPDWNVSTEALLQNQVYNSKEQKLGKVQNLIVGLPAGQFTFMIMATGGFLGYGENLFPVPWEFVAIDKDRKRLVIPLSRERLMAAPHFESSSRLLVHDSLWTASITDFYITEKKAHLQASESK